MPLEDIVWSGKLTISNQLVLINEIAERYDQLERVLMEYVDNSLDDADDAARSNCEEYPYLIKIKVIIDKKERLIKIIDNCRGMKIEALSRIVHNIGESKKKGCSWLNGRFGFGVHAFRGFAKEIEFQTKHTDDDYFILKLDRDSENIEIPIVSKNEFPTDTGTGTIVILKQFKEDYFDTLSVELIKEQIEEHFETMLKKQNLCIDVGYETGLCMTCKPFDYTGIPGKEYKCNDVVEYGGNSYPVELFFKVTDNITTTRRPRFFAKGRRILDIKDDKKFIGKSKYKTSVWDHSNLIGYVEVGELVKPTITRDGFEKGKNRTLLYDSALEMEDELKTALDEINNKSQDSSYTQLEDVLSKALKKLAREDSLKFKMEILKGPGNITLADGGGSEIIGGAGGPTGNGGSSGVCGGPGEGNGEGPKGSGDGNLQGSGSGGPLPKEGDSNCSGTTRRTSGFDIRFTKIDPDADGKLKRTIFSGGVISINKLHPDFKERLKNTRMGELMISRRLVSYIAAVISIHYKDQYYEKYHNQPDIRTELFDQQVEFIFRLENVLAPYLNEIKGLILSDAGDFIDE